MNKKISFEELCNPEFRRAAQMEVKSEAVWVTFLELDGLINLSKFAKAYFGKSQGWFAQKLHRNTVCGKERSFTTEEYTKLAASLRTLGERLIGYADAIDAASESSD